MIGRIQVREDGLGIDQIVFSAVTYLSRSPGATKNDTTILTRGGPLNAPPAIQITSPTANTQFPAPATVGIVADAFDTDGSVARVEFLANGTSVGSRTAPPWTFTWNGVGAGSYLLTARATDNEGATSTSGAVQIGVIASTTVDEVVLYAKTAVTHRCS